MRFGFMIQGALPKESKYQSVTFFGVSISKVNPSPKKQLFKCIITEVKKQYKPFKRTKIT